jgi:hypothetical protein
MLVDAADNALTSFLTLGTYMSTVTLTGSGWWSSRSPSTVTLPEEVGSPRRRAYVLHMQLPVDSLSIVYQVTLPHGQSVRKDARDVSFLTASDGAGQLYVAFSDVYQVRSWIGRGRPSGRPVSRRPVEEPPGDRRRARAAPSNTSVVPSGDVSDSLRRTPPVQIPCFR